MHLSVEMMGSRTKMTVSWAVLVQPVACFSRKYALASARLETSAQRPASSTLYACPAVAVPTALAIVSSVMGLTGLCVPKMGTHMTMTVGANRLSVGNSMLFPPSTRARVTRPHPHAMECSVHLGQYAQ